MKHIGIIPNRYKDKQLTITEEIARWLVSKDVTVYTTEDIAKDLDVKVDVLEGDALYAACECIIAIGGDGTILSVAEEACKQNVPIVGINLGRLGFLADIELLDMKTALMQLLNDDFTIDERMMLRATVTSPDGETIIFHALNEVNVARGSFARIVEFEISVNGELSDIYPADGIIVSTPTGSTAYNLSAGGPIILSNTKAYIITPICPHTINARPIVLSSLDEVQIRTLEDNDKTMTLSIDGKLKMYLTPDHVVRVEQSPYVTRLIKCSDRKFFEILREKIVERRK